MQAVLDIGILPSDLAERIRAYDHLPLVFFSCGLHPTSVAPETMKEELALLARQLSHTPGRIVAVGEVGLDFHWSDEYRTLQHQALEQQAVLARRHDLPLVIHNRDSEDEMLQFLRVNRPIGVMHCFSQGPEYCRHCLELGMYVSFGGNITYKSADEVREAARLVPDDRLLVETDSPYLSPQAVRGTVNHPGHLGFTIEALAELRRCKPESLARVTAGNARRLFRLPDAR
jgi:TatD DNase family protein